MANNVNIVVRAIDRTGDGLAAVNDAIYGLTTTADKANTSFGNWRTTAATIAPALVPIAAAAGPVAVSLTAATGALVAFGVAASGQIKDLSAAAEATRKYEDAVKEHGRTSAEAAKADLAHARALEEVPKATRRAAAAFQVMREEFNAWSDSLSDNTMPVFTKGMQNLQALFPELTPVVEQSSAELERFMAVVRGGIATDGFDRFMDDFADFASGALHEATTGVVSLTRALNEGEAGGNIKEFMDYARENGPLVADALSNIGDAVTNLLVAASDAGVGMLQAVNVLAQMVAAVPPEFLATLLQVAFAMKMIGLAGAGLNVARQGLHRMAVQIIAMRTAAGSTTGRIAGMRAALGTLSTGMKAGIIAGGLIAIAVGINKAADAARGAPPDVDKLTTSLKELAASGKFGGELKKTFGSLDGLSDKLHEAHMNASMFDLISGQLGDTLGGSTQNMYDLIDSFVQGEDSAKALREDFKSVDGALAGLVSSGNLDAARAGFRTLKEAAAENGISVRELKEQFPEYTKALEAHRAAQKLAAAGMGLFGEQAVKVQEKLEDQKASADGLRQSIQALNDVQRQGLGGMIGFEAAIDAAAEAAKKHAGALSMTKGRLNLNSEGARNAATALQDLAAKTDEAAASAREQGRSWSAVGAIYERGRKKLIASAEQMGLTREQARKLAAQILKTPDKTAYLRGNMEDLREKIRNAKDRLNDRGLTDPERTKIRARIDQLRDQVRKAKWQLNSIDDETVWITSYYTSIYRRQYEYDGLPGLGGGWAHGGVVGGRAMGGVIGTAASGGPRGNLTWVGEMGPELVSLPAGSTVKTAGDSQRMMRDTVRDARGGRGALGEGVVAGGRVLEGLANGMAGHLGRLVATTERVSRELVMSTRSTLGVSGGSPLFVEIGEQVGRDLAKGLEKAAPRVGEAARDLAQSAGKAARKVSKPSGGMGAAIRELERRVSSGKWNNKGSLVFEDMSFQGMSGNYEKHQDAVADRFWDAVREIKRARDRGTRVHEDMAFKGMSKNVNRFHGMIADIWRGNPWGTTFGDWGKWAPQGADLPRRASGGIGGGLTWVGERGPELVDLAPGSTVRSAGDSRRVARAAGGQERIVLEFRSSGRSEDDLLLERVRKAIRVRGGDAQVVLGGKGRG